MGTSKNMKSTKNSVYKSFRLYGASNNKDQGKLVNIILFNTTQTSLFSYLFLL